MHIYRLTIGDTVFAKDDAWKKSPAFSCDALFQSADPAAHAREAFDATEPTDKIDPATTQLAPPMEHQEIWATGVTYYRSRDARIEESEKSGGDIFYDKVYGAERPELFIKGGRSRSVGHLQDISLRSDSTWDVPEPELTLAVSSVGKTFGLTISNDLSSRSIEGENLLSLPQAKVWRKSAALGPALYIADAIAAATPIAISIERGGQEVFSGDTTLEGMKRSLDELVGFLMRDNEFPDGTYLMTGPASSPAPTSLYEAATR